MCKKFWPAVCRNECFIVVFGDYYSIALSHHYLISENTENLDCHWISTFRCLWLKFINHLLADVLKNSSFYSFFSSSGLLKWNVYIVGALEESKMDLSSQKGVLWLRRRNFCCYSWHDHAWVGFFIFFIIFWNENITTVTCKVSFSSLTHITSFMLLKIESSLKQFYRCLPSIFVFPHFLCFENSRKYDFLTIAA